MAKTFTILAIVILGLTSPSWGQDDGNCKILKDESDGTTYGICDSDDVEGTYEIDENAMFEAFNRSVEGNEGLYDDVANEDPSVDEQPTTERPQTTRATSINQREKRQTGETTNCVDRCWTSKPRWVYAYGRWWRVVQLPCFRQYLRRCWCHQTCAGRNSEGWWWFGRCVRERSWKKILVWSPFWPHLRWIWVKYDHGCCCVPYHYSK